MIVSFTLNHKPITFYAEPNRRLVDVLREELQLTGTKEACGEGECGACTILLDGEAVHSCMILISQVEGRDVLTIEGLAQNGQLDIIQQAFVECAAIQCGFCTPGMIMSTKGLLLKNPAPSDEEIRTALAGNICRCTGYVQIVDAVKLAAERLREVSGK